MRLQDVAHVAYDRLEEPALVMLAQQGHREAFQVIIQRCNQRLFRVARSIVRNEAEAEDVVQETYARAFEALGAFRGQASIATWLTRITLNEARGRLRVRRKTVGLDQLEAAQAAGGDVIPFPTNSGSESPEASADRMQIRHLLEEAVDALPSAFRVVFILRDVEDCSIQETADFLDIRPDTVKTRLHRARRLLRAQLDQTIGAGMKDAFPFMGARCARMMAGVMSRLDRQSRRG